VIVTTDDPHSEDPEQIINEIIKGVSSRYPLPLPAGRHGVTRYSDRRQAIEQALHSAQKGDIVLIAGRGHEKFQDFGSKQVPFDDREVVKEILSKRS
jgi:UDP-N-acetylmuramoyl-L-alanyl-D-glutamate--2,6-diaminopimelate ligase